MKRKLILICGALFTSLATAAAAESPQSSPLASVETNELRLRIENLESRVGSHLEHSNFRPTKRSEPTVRKEEADYEPEK
jgi:hypothetical protein